MNDIEGTVSDYSIISTSILSTGKVPISPSSNGIIHHFTQIVSTNTSSSPVIRGIIQAGTNRTNSQKAHCKKALLILALQFGMTIYHQKFGLLKSQQKKAIFPPSSFGLQPKCFVFTKRVCSHIGASASSHACVFPSRLVIN